MTASAWGWFHGLQLVEHELLLFTLFWFVIGMADELAIDCAWVWLRLTGRGKTLPLPEAAQSRELSGMMAVFIPAWQEADVIGATITHMRRVWQHEHFRIYVGCYANDAATVRAAMAGAGDDARVRVVIHDRHGPTTKADCLNRLYAALRADEVRMGADFRGVVLHDAEDMVHPAGLIAIDRALDYHQFVQLPVRPEPQRASRWVAGHYADEFTEDHAKAMVVRDALGAGLPAAGVGCGFARDMLRALAGIRRKGGDDGPFAAECLTEDYELGLLIARSGGSGRFLRLRDGDGALVATRSYFPADLTTAVRQKTRWVHGIALQSWDRLGWSGRAVDIWMTLRDRRGPLTALVLAMAYVSLLAEGVLLIAEGAGWYLRSPPDALLRGLMILNFAGFAWRALVRFTFTTRGYGLIDGCCAVLRIPVANVIAIMAGRRAMLAYWRSLRGGAVVWDKTTHQSHPSRATCGEMAL